MLSRVLKKDSSDKLTCTSNAWNCEHLHNSKGFEGKLTPIKSAILEVDPKSIPLQNYPGAHPALGSAGSSGFKHNDIKDI